jgi:hypothetical protein
MKSICIFHPTSRKRERERGEEKKGNVKPWMSGRMKRKRKISSKKQIGREGGR